MRCKGEFDLNVIDASGSSGGRQSRMDFGGCLRACAIVFYRVELFMPGRVLAPNSRVRVQYNIMSSFSLSHPINTALLLYALYLLQRIIVPQTSVPRVPPAEFKAGYSWLPRTHVPAILFTTYTPRTLAKFDGKDGGRILLAIAGTVFDVTAGRGFYGPGKPPHHGIGD